MVDVALMKDVLIRAMAPGTLDSLRITLGWCWTYLLIAEIVASNSGIGYELWTARRYGKTPAANAPRWPPMFRGKTTFCGCWARWKAGWEVSTSWSTMPAS